MDDPTAEASALTNDALSKHQPLQLASKYLEVSLEWQVEANVSLDWFKGKFTGLSPIFNGKIYGFRLRFSLKPIQ